MLCVAAVSLGLSPRPVAEVAGSIEPLVINYVTGLKSILPAPDGNLGATHVILSFLEPFTKELPGPDENTWVQGAVAEYAELSSREKDDLRRQLGTKNKPAKLMASLGGANAKHDDFHWQFFDPEAFGRRAAEYVIDLGLDGLDIDLEGWSTWVGVGVKEAREDHHDALWHWRHNDVAFQFRTASHAVQSSNNGSRSKGNNIGLRESNWVVDDNGPDFVKRLTMAVRERFHKAHKEGEPPYILSHAPQLPDFHKGRTYEHLLADQEFFDAIDFINVQFYNQFVFDSNAQIFTEDIYPPEAGGPTCLASLVNATVKTSERRGSRRTPEEVASKLVLGFPCLGGSFQIADYNHNECDAEKAAEVLATGVELGYPLRGVFEWSARPPSVYPDLLSTWNKVTRAALKSKALPKLGKKSAKTGYCHTLAPPTSGLDDKWCIVVCPRQTRTLASAINAWSATDMHVEPMSSQSCARDFCPKILCSGECVLSNHLTRDDWKRQQEQGQQQQGQKQQAQQQESKHLKRSPANQPARSIAKCHSLTAGIQDGWCVETCSQGKCSAEFCSRDCRSLGPKSLRQQEEQAARTSNCFTIAPPESHIDDAWCDASCAQGFCPSDLCGEGCMSLMSAASGKNESVVKEVSVGPGGAEASNGQSGDADADSGCHSVATEGTGIDDQWCVNSCSQHICPDSLCSQECLSLSYRLRRLSASSLVPSSSPSPASAIEAADARTDVLEARHLGWARWRASWPAPSSSASAPTAAVPSPAPSSGSSLLDRYFFEEYHLLRKNDD